MRCELVRELCVLPTTTTHQTRCSLRGCEGEESLQERRAFASHVSSVCACPECSRIESQAVLPVSACWQAT